MSILLVCNWPRYSVAPSLTWVHCVSGTRLGTVLLLRLHGYIHCLSENFVFVLIIYVPSTIFQLNRDGSSCVEPLLS